MILTTLALTASLALSTLEAPPVLPQLPAAVTQTAAVAPGASHDLGVVTRSLRGASGVEVLAVTPGGAAERMGLRAGDRILAINGTRLDGPGATQALQQAVATGDGGARLEVQREGATRTLTGTLDPVASPQVPAGCGYVTTIGQLPRVSRHIFQADITQIDGRSTPLRPMNRYRLDAGRHVLVIREQIDWQGINSAQHALIMRGRQLMGKRAYKTLLVEVEPGKSYHVGAQLHRDRLDHPSIRNNAWWEPVLWEVRDEACN